MLISIIAPLHFVIYDKQRTFPSLDQEGIISAI